MSSSDVARPTIDDRWLVIANCEDELALCPASRVIPASWRPLFGSAPRETCLSFLQRLEAERRANVLRRLLESHLIHP